MGQEGSGWLPELYPYGVDVGSCRVSSAVRPYHRVHAFSTILWITLQWSQDCCSTLKFKKKNPLNNYTQKQKWRGKGFSTSFIRKENLLEFLQETTSYISTKIGSTSRAKLWHLTCQCNFNLHHFMETLMSKHPSIPASWPPFSFSQLHSWPHFVIYILSISRMMNDHD